MNSWDKSDSGLTHINTTDVGFGYDPNYEYIVGENDLKLMKSLAKAGSDHGKFLRFIGVTFDVTAPLYWWKEFDTYRVGVVPNPTDIELNSCSTMHKIHAKEFELSDFSFEHLTPGAIEAVAKPIVIVLNGTRDAYLNYEKYNEEDPEGWDEGITCKKDLWWQMIQMLPSSYNQKRTVQLNYQVLKTMYFARKDHKLDCWRDFCKWIEELPYFKEIVLDE
jgi:hypothetical protein